MKGKANIGAIVLGVIMALCITVGFFFLGYFCRDKEWITVKEPVIEDQVEDGNEDEQLPDEGNEDETGGETAATKTMAYTVSLKADVTPYAVDLPVGPSWLCMECGEGTVSRTFYRAASCMDAELSIYECDRCDYRSEETSPALGHDFTAEEKAATSVYCADTLRTCDRCGMTYYALSGTSSRTGHTWDTLEEQAPTCTTEGYEKMECLTCGHTEETTIPTTAHTPDGGKVTKYATCTTEGVKTISCAVCGEVLEEQVIPKTDHKYTNNGNGTIEEVTDDDGIVEAEPTCTEDGKIVYYCLTCNGAAQEVTIKATGHNWANVAAVEPTCTENGHAAGRQCANCDAWYGGAEPAVIEALGHDWTEWVEDRDSCDVAGERTRTCNRCQEVESEQLSAGQHSWDDGVITKAPTCTTTGVKTKACELCDATTTETVPATGHKRAALAAVDPTCTTTGLTAGERCTACGLTFTAQQIIPATGHDMEYHAAVAPTEAAGGNIEYWQCKTCGVCYTDAEGKTEVKAEDTLLPPVGVEQPGDDPAADAAGLEWWHWALIVGGSVIVIGLALVVIDQIAQRNKAAGKTKSKSKSKKR